MGGKLTPLNWVQDINTLSLVVRVITSLSPSMSEYAVLANSFELLGAFDEIVSLGYKENASLQQIRNVLEGESHEEKIQEIIARVSPFPHYPRYRDATS